MRDPLVLKNGQLTQAQKDQYWAEGYLFPFQVASKDQALKWRKSLETIETEWLDNGLPLPLNTYKRVNAQVVMPLALEIGMHGPTLDVVEGILLISKLSPSSTHTETGRPGLLSPTSGFQHFLDLHGRCRLDEGIVPR